MKAVVVGIKGSIAAILSNDGCVKKVKNHGYMVGQKILLEDTQRPVNWLMPAVSAAAAFLVACGAGAYMYFTPYTLVSLDVNPSIEYSLNRFDRVLHVKGVNDGGKDIIGEIELSALNNKPIGEAISQTVRQIKDAGYFDGGDDEIEESIVIATATKDEKKAQSLADELKRKAVEAVPDKHVAVETFSVEETCVKQAQDLGVSPGKLTLIEKLQETSHDPEPVNTEDWIDRPVKEIMHEIKEKEREEQERADRRDEREPREEETRDSETDSLQEPRDSACVAEKETDSTRDSVPEPIESQPAAPVPDSSSGVADSQAAAPRDSSQAGHSSREQAVTDSKRPLDSQKVTDSGQVLDSGKALDSSQVLDSGQTPDSGKVQDSKQQALDSGQTLDSSRALDSGPVFDSAKAPSQPGEPSSSAASSSSSEASSSQAAPKGEEAEETSSAAKSSSTSGKIKTEEKKEDVKASSSQDEKALPATEAKTEKTQSSSKSA